MKVNIRKEERLLDEFFKVKKASLQFENFDGSMSDEVDRYVVCKSEAVAVLIYHTEKKAYLLVRQFRYPLHDKEKDPWMTEIVAGGMNKGESPQEAAEREVMEETGFKVLRFEHICSCYVSPGIMDEKVHIMLAETDNAHRKENGGGAEDEDEDIMLVWVKEEEALQWLQQQDPGDAKTILAIQWHRLRQR